LIFFIVLRAQERPEVFIGDDQFARADRAPAEDHFGAVFQLSLEVALVAGAAQGMAAFHADVVASLVVADGAAEVLTRISQLTHSLVSLVQVDIKHVSIEFFRVVKIEI
jgi:hypothetical protein